ncbi:MAG: DUF3857 domain-containing protein [Prevotella sp.]|nr:DUF3857 domain-containing protein [Prevotella sp.]
MKNYSPDPDAEAVVLYSWMDIYYDYNSKGLQVIKERKIRYKVLKEDGTKVANVEIPYLSIPGNRTMEEFVSGIKAVAYNLDGGKVTRTRMDGSLIHRERADKNMMVMKFAVPQVKVGTVLEVQYKMTSDFYDNIDTWYAQGAFPVRFAGYRLTIPDFFKFQVEYSGFYTLQGSQRKTSSNLRIPGLPSSVTMTEYMFVGSNIPAMKGDAYVWNVGDFRAKVTAELSSVQIPGELIKNYTTTWGEISKTLLAEKDFGGRLGQACPYKDEIAALPLSSMNVRKKMEAVCALLRRKLKWNGKYGFWGKSLKQVAEEGTGDNAELNFVLMSMLREAGLKAEPVVMRSRDRGRMPLTHPSEKFLNTFIVSVEENDSSLLFYDASAEMGAVNVMPARLYVDKGVIPLTMGIKEVDLTEYAVGKETDVVQASLSAEGLLTGNISSLYTGLAALAKREALKAAKDSSSYVSEMAKENGVAITAYSVKGKTDFSDRVSTVASFSRHCDGDGTHIYLNPFLFAPVNKSPFPAPMRNIPIEFPYKMTHLSSVMIRLPEGYTVEEVPAPVQVATGQRGILVLIQVVGEGSILRVNYRISINETQYVMEEYPSVKAIFDRIVDECQKLVVIKKVG